MVILISRQYWDPINKTTSKAIVRIFNSTGYFLPLHQKECFKSRPGRSTSAAKSASTSTACQQPICGTSAQTQTVLFTEINKMVFSEDGRSFSIKSSLEIWLTNVEGSPKKYLDFDNRISLYFQLCTKYFWVLGLLT